MADISNIKQLAKTLNLSNVAKGKISLGNQDKRTLDFIESMFLQEIEFRRKNRIKLLKETLIFQILNSEEISCKMVLYGR